MAKAHITNKDGSTILIEGTADEVATLVSRLGGGAIGASASGTSSPFGHTGRKKKARGKTTRKSKAGPANLVADLIQVGTFKKPKGLGDIQAELKQGGHYYNNASVAVALLRAVKSKELRRIKQDGKWVYVN